jgi:hypothetical protein
MKRLITIIAIQSTLIIASGDDGSWFFGKEGLKKADSILKKVPAIAGEAGTEFGTNLLAGALTQLPADKRREIGGDLAHGFIDKMNTPEGHDAAYKLGENVIKGAAGGAVIVAGMAKDVVVAKTVATAVAAKGAAIVAAPYVGVAAVVGGAFYGIYEGGQTIIKHDESFKRCLNANLRSRDINSRGFSSRCESPERKIAWWDHYKSYQSIEAYKARRQKEGL